MSDSLKLIYDNSDHPYAKQYITENPNSCWEFHYYCNIIDYIKIAFDSDFQSALDTLITKKELDKIGYYSASNYYPLIYKLVCAGALLNKESSYDGVILKTKINYQEYEEYVKREQQNEAFQKFKNDVSYKKLENFHKLFNDNLNELEKSTGFPHITMPVVNKVKVLVYDKINVLEAKNKELEAQLEAYKANELKIKDLLAN